MQQCNETYTAEYHASLCVDTPYEEEKNTTPRNSIVLHFDNSCTIEVKILLCTEIKGERKRKFDKITSMMNADLTTITLQKFQNILWRTQNFLRNHSQ